MIKTDTVIITIAVHNNVFHRLTLSDCHQQLIQCQIADLRRFYQPVHYITGKKIDNYRQIQPAQPSVDIGNIV